MTDNNQHAFLAPSGYDAWSRCLGKAALEEHLPDSSSADADYGTLAHHFAALWLRRGSPPWPYHNGVLQAPTVPDGSDEEMRQGVATYVIALLTAKENYEKLGAEVTLLIEQKLPIHLITNEQGAEGTADAILLADFGEHTVMEGWDLKFGTGVTVEVERNGQLMMYGLTALIRYSPLHNITEVHLVIHQPRQREEPKRWQVSPDELYVFGAEATEKAAKALALRNQPEALNHLTPGEKQCRFCRAKPQCKAYRGWIDANVLKGFEDFSKPASITAAIEGKGMLMEESEYAAWLGQQRMKVALASAWCKVILEESDRLAAKGVDIPGWKLVDGRAGNRKYKDPSQALTTVLLHGINQSQVVTEPELISPAQLEAKLPPKLHRALWADLREEITQSPPAPTLVLESDPRPARPKQAKAQDFEELPANE